MNTTVSTTAARKALVEQMEKLREAVRQLDFAMGDIAPDGFPHVVQLDALAVVDRAQETLTEANKILLAARTFTMQADALARQADAAKDAKA